MIIKSNGKGANISCENSKGIRRSEIVSKSMLNLEIVKCIESNVIVALEMNKFIHFQYIQCISVALTVFFQCLYTFCIFFTTDSLFDNNESK